MESTSGGVSSKATSCLLESIVSGAEGGVGVRGSLEREQRGPLQGAGEGVGMPSGIGAPRVSWSWEVSLCCGAGWLCCG